MKNLIIVLIALISITSCKKEIIKPNIPTPQEYIFDNHKFIQGDWKVTNTQYEYNNWVDNSEYNGFQWQITNCEILGSVYSIKDSIITVDKDWGTKDIFTIIEKDTINNKMVLYLEAEQGDIVKYHLTKY